MSRQILHESETVELKTSLAELKQGLISMTAILNKHQAGILWFGVRNDGAVTGIDAGDKTLRDLSQAIAAHIEPRIVPKITKVTVKGKRCIKVEFSGNDTPYFAYGRAFMRVADEDRQLSVKQLKDLLVAQTRESLRWDNQPGQFTLADLDQAKLKRFVKRANLVWDNAKNALTKLELIKAGRLLNAARLFFGTKPLQLRCAVFLTTETATIIDRHDFDGDILELIEEAQKYILKNIHIGMRIEGMRRVDVPEISVEALREAVINAFCHRDYYDPDYVQVAVFKDRVEIRNPGKLYGNLTIADLRKGNVSKRRNPLIADLFRRIDMVEAWGRGMTLILEKEPNVTFKEVADLFIAAFDRPSFFESTEEAAARKEKKDSAEVRKKGSGKSPEKSSEKMIRLLQQNKRLTIAVLSREIGISTRAVEKNLKKMQNSGRLQRVGADKGGYWKVLGSQGHVAAATIPKDIADHPEEEKGSEKSTEKDSEKSTEKILRLLQRNKRLTIAALSRQIGISTRAIEKNLKQLRNSGRLRRVGATKGGHWEVIVGVPSPKPGGNG